MITPAASEGGGGGGGLGGFSSPSDWANAFDTTFGSKTSTHSNVHTTGTNTSTGKQQSLSDEDQETLRQLATMFTQHAQNYDKNAAIADSEALQGSVIKTLRESVLPGIQAQQAIAGGYNQTGVAQLQNDAISRAGSDLAALRLSTIAQYGQLQQGDYSGANAVMEALKGSLVTNDQTQTMDQTQVSDVDNEDKGTWG